MVAISLKVIVMSLEMVRGILNATVELLEASCFI
jgi:hypothetical protein